MNVNTNDIAHGAEHFVQFDAKVLELLARLATQSLLFEAQPPQVCTVLKLFRVEIPIFY